MISIIWECLKPYKTVLAQLAGAVEYTDYTSAEG